MSTNANEDTAAYQGRGWQPRPADHRDELARGALWGACGVDSEWAALRDVVLTLPDPGWPVPADWRQAQYLAPVEFAALRDELIAYGEALRARGVTVHFATAPAAPVGGAILYNAVFSRDQFFTTPEGVIVGRMASVPRAGEERGVAAFLAGLGAPIVRTLRGRACFEGADALWLSPTRVAIGTDNRTNHDAVAQVSASLAEQGVEVVTGPLPSGIQHLLGILQIVGPRTAVIRRDKPLPDSLRGALRGLDYRLIELPVDDEVVAGQAMNFVTLAAHEVIMLADRPRTEAALAAAGITTHAVVRADHLLRAAGGLACATGILRRAVVRG
ncbi:MAG TPA: arginine deiminase family protein [Kofleriaceae bacterium]|nr:arginine deiminase family protein [Kofleriaceae bacterium]